jgi:membrane protease YdiL (CAAX protease family)
VLNPVLEKMHFPDRGMTAGSLALNEGLDFVLIGFFSWIIARLGRERVSDYGLALRRGWVRRFLSGVMWGTIPSVMILIPIWLAGACSFRGLAVHGVDLARSAGVWGVAFLLVGFAEEFTFRGCAQATLGEAIGFWPAALLLSGLFGLVHLLFKENEGWVDPISVALYGLFWCFTLRRTGSLWFAVGFHAASDYVDMVVFAEPNTGAGGHAVPGHLLDVAFHGPAWLTGGPRGTEASLLVFPVLAVLFYVFNVLYPERAERTKAGSGELSAV